MNRKIKKMIIILFIMVIVISIRVVSNAQEEEPKAGSNIVAMFGTAGSEDIEGGKTLITKIVVPILNVVRIVATGVSIIMITYLGIKYMSASPTEKANIKGQLITFTIGAIVVIGTVSILDIIKDTFENIFNTTL